MTKSGLSPCEDFYPDPEGSNRYTACVKTFKRSQDLKAHRNKTKHYDDSQDVISPAAERKTKEVEKESIQQELSTVKSVKTSAKNCCQFECLGAIFQTDRKQMSDV